MADKQIPILSGKNIHLDETYHKIKSKDAYRWSVKDKGTKYRLYGSLTKNRDYKTGAKPEFKHLKKLCYSQFLQRKKEGKKIRLVSDKLAAYKKGFNNFFRNVAILTHGVSIKAKKAGLKYNNNCIERDHQYNKQRYKTMRGFKEIESANNILNFFDIHYNFIDRQKILGKTQTPAEAAGIYKNLGETYTLLKLIEKSNED